MKNSYRPLEHFDLPQPTPKELLLRRSIASVTIKLQSRAKLGGPNAQPNKEWFGFEPLEVIAAILGLFLWPLAIWGFGTLMQTPVAQRGLNGLQDLGAVLILPVLLAVAAWAISLVLKTK